jgi:hypothetical protein
LSAEPPADPHHFDRRWHFGHAKTHGNLHILPNITAF